MGMARRAAMSEGATMSTDNLPQRLREEAIHPSNHVKWQRLRNQAADALEAKDDEIERLQVRVRQLQGEEHRLDVENGQLRAELERTRRAWVDGDDPMCQDVCMIECKGPCGVGGVS